MKLTVQSREAFAYTGGKPFDPKLPVVVFIHGAMHDHSVWGLQSRSLAHHGFAVLAVDLPGHGRSAGPAPASVEAAAQWHVDLLDAAGVGRAALVGHSMGSLIALEAAARLGTRASHLVLVGTAFPMKVSPALIATAEETPLKAIDMVNAFSHSTLAAKPSAPAPGFWLHGANRALMRRLQAGYAAQGHGNLFHQDFLACDRYARGLDAAAQVQCPARMILGAADQMTPPRAAEALASVLRCHNVILPAGHSLMGEAPDGVLNGISSFFSRTP
ncbi:alpha/beta hydrolase [Rhizobacter sp. J219]|uniref:alpha/beta fold hydrolase n=1 Tax=Rhizobacter sp. J219 TaxID=2898430 RepID=UPI0021508AA7|nr:alpha/beta hydrolase [Rhizobacter sp. J219]MCR5881687.1 alpha/beta hydrolase [Rhizobacter sp. J219]